MKRIAIFVHGGLVPDWSTDKVPALQGLIERLSTRFDLTVYTTIGPDRHDQPFHCGQALVKFVGAGQEDHTGRRVLQTLRAFRKDHRVRPYALVHGFWALPGGVAAVAAGKMSGLPSVVSLQGGEAAHLPEIQYGNMISGAARESTLWACREAGDLTFLTRYQLDQLRRFRFNRPDDIHIIPFGAEAGLFECAEREPPVSPYRFLHIGHLNRVKDQVTLLKAFKALRQTVDCRLRIVGEDTLGGALQECAANLGIAPDVTFAGLVPHEELRHSFAWSHVLLHTSLYEAEGVVFAEAAASGVPVCGTNVGLLADLGPSYAVTVDPGDFQGLAREALDLVRDTPRWESLRRQARSWAIEHSSDWTARQFEELYNHIIPSEACAGDGTGTPGHD